MFLARIQFPMSNIIGERMKRIIYADNAATTKLDNEAFDVMTPYLLNEYGNASQPYSFSRKPKMTVAEARKIIASAINALPEEIYFTSGGTESDNWAIKGFGTPGEVKTIFTSAIEHHAVLNACNHQKENGGCSVIILPVDGFGILQPSVLKEAMTIESSNRPIASYETKLVSVMFANNEIGSIEPIKELAKIAHENGALFHTDAVQAVGHIPIDVQDLDVDMLSASAHKFNGPKGVGFLYLRKGTKIQSLIDGGSQENGLRAGTENTAGIVGMATALKANCEQMLANKEHIEHLENKLISKISELDYIRNGSKQHIPGNINISIKGENGERILHRMDLKGVCISTGSACDSKNMQLSHVIKAIGVPTEYAEGTIRITLGKYNTEEEVDLIAEALVQVLSK